MQIEPAAEVSAKTKKKKITKSKKHAHRSEVLSTDSLGVQESYINMENDVVNSEEEEDETTRMMEDHARLRDKLRQLTLGFETLVLNAPSSK